jgi:tetratricopeptide (TPR) repeat protein
VSQAAGSAAGAALSTPRSGVRRPWNLLVPAGLVTLGVYLPSLWNDFVQWDDGMAFLDNPNYRGLAPANLRWMFTTFLLGHYQPLSWITLGFDHVVWGMNPIGYHLTNILLHAAAAIAFGWCAAWIFEESGGADPAASGFGRSSSWFGALVALGWALHPLRVEAVTWITERREVLCGLLTLLAVASHLRRGPRWATAVLTLLAMLAKATAVTIPVFVVLIDVVRSRESEPRALLRAAGMAIARNAHLVAMAAVFSVVAVFAQKDAKAIVSYSELLLSRRIGLSFFGVAFCVIRTLAPYGLAPLHQGKVGMTWELHPPVWWQAAGGFVLVLVALACGWRRRRRGLGLLAGTLAFVAMVLPTGGLGQSGPQAAADRYTYQAAWVVTLGIGLLGAALAARAPSLRRCLAAATLAVLAVLGSLSVRQQRVWRDTESLWRRQLEVYPASPIGHNQLGYYLVGKKDPVQAEVHLRRALALAPEYVDPKCSLAGVLISSGRPEEAVGLLESALRTKPGHLPALFLLAKTLWDVGRIDESVAAFEKLAQADAANPEAHRQLAKAQAAASRPTDAVASFDRGIAAAPSPELYSDFAWLLATHPDAAVRNGPKAVAMAEKAVAAGQSGVRTILMLAAARAEAGDFDRAIAEVEAAIPGLPPETASKLRNLIADLEKHEAVRAEPRFP